MNKKEFFQSRFTMLPDGEHSVHTPCGTPDDLSYRAIGAPFEGSPLPTSSQLPLTAMQYEPLEQRVQSFLASTTCMRGGRLFCKNSPECTVTVHDLRIRVLEPLVLFVLQQYHEKTGEEAKKLNGRYILQYRPENLGRVQLPGDITLSLRNAQAEVASSMVISFEEDSSFLSFGLQPNLFAGMDECKLYLYQAGPIPLDPSGRSHGAQAMLNKQMQSAVQRNPATNQVEVPVRYSMIMSPHLAMLAESGTLPSAPSNYIPQRSVTLIFLATILNHLLHTHAPSSKTIELLFNTRKELPDQPRDRSSADMQQAADGSVSCTIPSNEDEKATDVSSERSDQTAKLNTTLWPPRIGFCKLEWWGKYLPMEAVIFQVAAYSNEPSRSPRYKPSRRLNHLYPALLAYLDKPLNAEYGGTPKEFALSDLRDVKLVSLPRLEALEARGPAANDKQSKEGARDGQVRGSASDGEARRSSTPTDQPVVIKLFDDDSKLEAEIRESLFYEWVFPLLPKEARVLLPRYYGTCRSSDARTLALIMGYGGHPITFAEESNDEFQQKISDAYKVFDKCGVDHSDREPHNVLLRLDDSLCLIDWNLAILNFGPRFRGLK
ncbi:BQ2448_1408 [Microbotryum intermedium]|uniref:BQ2448_1408 protein n=1 Tax=Microbotryum intermedium TaxID=269621 RepID=A0A238FDQ4_9BASI|nr:BQ2448_1408 [Microbotryum intermedium]